MDLAAQLRLTSIPKQHAVAIITRTIRIVMLQTIAVPHKTATVRYLPIKRLTIAQIVQFVRQFLLRESWQF